MAIDDVFILTTTANQLGSLRQNSLAFIATTETDPSVGIFAPIAADIKELYRLLQSNTVTYTTWRARQIAGAGVTWPDTGSNCFPTGGEFFEAAFSGSVTGADPAAEVLPPQCALVTTLRSGLVGRSHRGRVYGYGWTEAQQAAGVWSAGLLTSLDTAWNSFLTEYAVAAPVSGYRLGVWSTRIASGCRVNRDGTHERTGPAQPEIAFTPVTSHINRTTVFTQRRRVTGHGL